MPSILRDVHGRPATTQHRLVPAVPAECVDEEMVAVLDAVAGPATLSHLGDLSDAEVERHRRSGCGSSSVSCRRPASTCTS